APAVRRRRAPRGVRARRRPQGTSPQRLLVDVAALLVGGHDRVGGAGRLRARVAAEQRDAAEAHERDEREQEGVFDEVGSEVTGGAPDPASTPLGGVLHVTERDRYRTERQ